MADCLILDVHMKGMTGLELLERMQEEGDNPPVIVMTGRPTASIHDRAAAAGAFACAREPFSGAQLVETVLSAIAAKNGPAGVRDAARPAGSKREPNGTAAGVPSYAAAACG